MKVYGLNLFTGLILGVTAVVPIAKIESNDEVLHLIGEPDFRDVSLRWEYEQSPAPLEEERGSRDAPEKAPHGFQVHYCEIQAWGPHRCRTKVIENADETTNLVAGSARRGRSGRSFRAQIGGLRMATTYSFEVRPVERAARALRDDTQPIGKSIIVPTKGFSARATQCLPHASEVEVSTGPHFGGRIAVEAADGGPERCALQGNPNSAQDAYTLRIHHDECGSDVNDTTVATYVIVQENLPILTHSTRRFLVLCTYKPETLTVRAGINLPKSPSGDALQQHYRPQSGSVEPLDAEMDYNEVQPARLEAAPEESEDGMAGEIALVVFLVMACFVGIALLVWKMVPQAERDDVSISTVSSTRSGLFGRLASKNIDRFSDMGSVYSITLSERDECDSRIPNVGSDNTSEA